MKLKWSICPSEEVMKRFKEIEDKEEDEYLDERILKKSSAQFIEFHINQKWVGYALIESLKEVSVGSLLDDIYDEEDFEKAKDYIETHMKENGYYIHVFKIFEEYQRKGYGKLAEHVLMNELQSPILLYTVAESLDFWERQGYETLNGEYYYIKVMEQSHQLAG